MDSQTLAVTVRPLTLLSKAVTLQKKDVSIQSGMRWSENKYMLSSLSNVL